MRKDSTQIMMLHQFGLDEMTTKLDMAGIRVVCRFTSDIYLMHDALSRQQDVTVREVRDYIAQPKTNGCKSLRMIVEVPAFLSDRIEPATIVIQIRTIAMDFWASLEHKIHYKCEREFLNQIWRNSPKRQTRQANWTARCLDCVMKYSN